MADEVVVRDVAREFMGKHSSVDDATAAMVAEARRDRALFYAIMNPILAETCRNLVTDVQRQARRDAWAGLSHAGTTAQRPLSAAALTDIAQDRAATFLRQFRLPNGTPLGDALRGDVLEAALFYQTQASDMAAKGRFLEMVAGCMTDADKSVAEQMSDADAIELRDRAKELPPTADIVALPAPKARPAKPKRVLAKAA